MSNPKQQAETQEQPKLEDIIREAQKGVKPEYFQYDSEYQSELNAISYCVTLGYNAATSHLQGEVERLKEAIADQATKHQEELSNYNSYAASAMQSDFENAIEKAIVDLQSKAHMIQSMMSPEESAPIKSAFEIAVSVLKDINADEF